jgi:hypothetical protein
MNDAPQVPTPEARLYGQPTSYPLPAGAAPARSGRTWVLISAATVIVLWLANNFWEILLLKTFDPMEGPSTLAKLAWAVMPLVYAGVLLTIGLTTMRRIAGAGIAVLISVLVLANSLVLQRLLFENVENFDAFRVYSAFIGALFAALYASAWGAARRIGFLWPIGVLVTFVCQAGFAWWNPIPFYEWTDSQLLITTAYNATFGLFVLVGGLIGWASDQPARARSTTS